MIQITPIQGGVEVAFAYNCGIDEYGHLFGPESNIIKNAVARTDAHLATFIAAMEAEELLGAIL